MGLPCLRPEAASVTSTTSIAEGQDIQRYHGAMHMGVQRRGEAVYDVGFTGLTGNPAYVATCMLSTDSPRTPLSTMRRTAFASTR